MREVFLFLHDGGADAVDAFADDVSACGRVTVLDFVMIGIEDDALSFVDDFRDHASADAFRELFVEREPSVVAVDGHENLWGDEVDEEFEFALVAVAGAVERELGSVDEAGALAVEAVDDCGDAALVAGNLARGVDERVGWSQLDLGMVALGDFEE